MTDAHAKQAHAHLPPESKAVSTRTIRARAMERAPVSSVSKVSNEGAPATAGYQRFHRPAVAISCFCSFPFVTCSRISNLVSSP